MELTPQPVDRTASHAGNAVREASPWIERLARLGYAAKGVVYIVIGVLAAQAATSAGEDVADSGEALRTIIEQPFGQILLGIVALGLIGYVIWRFVQAALDPERKGTDTKGVVTRAGYAISGVIYGALAVEAARMVLGSSDGGGGEGAEDWTAVLMSQPFGPYLVAAVGIGVGAYGLWQLYRAYTVELSKRLDLSELDADTRRWAIRIGRFGLAARGVVFGIIAIFLVRAALQSDPGEARGLGGALETLHQQPYGPWLLGIVALGLVAYGVFELIKSRFRRIRAPGEAPSPYAMG